MKLNDATKTALAAILMALAATESGSTREGIAYAALMGVCPLEDFQTAIAILAKLGHIARGSNFLISITEKGRELAEELEAVAKKAKGAV